MIQINKSAVCCGLLFRVFVGALSSTLCVAFISQPSRVFFPLIPLQQRSSTTHSHRLSSVLALSECENQAVESADAIVCGGGPAGLLTAIMLAQRFKKSRNQFVIKVFERRRPYDDPDQNDIWNDIARFYLIGLGGRGQSVLQHFGVWNDIQSRCVPVIGRKDWAPDSGLEGTERIFTKQDKLVTAQILPRDKLVAILHQHITNQYADCIQLNYGYNIQPLDFDYNCGTSVLLQVSGDNDSIKLLSTNALVAADGTVRTFAHSVERLHQEQLATMNPVQRLFTRPFRVKRYHDDNQRVYKTIPIKLPSSWNGNLNYSARTKKNIIFEALPANTNKEFCAVLLLHKDHPLAAADTDPVDVRALLDTFFPQFSAILDDNTIKTVAAKPVSYLPGFRYVGPRLHHGSSCVMLGDCIHTVKPYFGLGCNVALEDVKILSDCLDEHNNDFAQSIQEFSKRRAADSKALVQLSRELDRPGLLGVFTFILPLVLDSIFFGMAPKLFRPNVIAMMQQEKFSFRQVARRKRLDRCLQISILVSVIFSLLGIGMALINQLANALQQDKMTILLEVTASILAVRILGRAITKLAPALSPFTIFNKLSSKVLNSRTHLTPLRKLARPNQGNSMNGESFLTPIGFQKPMQNNTFQVSEAL